MRAFVCVVQVGGQRVELTLTELQEMATRQQQQIEAQQQMLVAKVTKRVSPSLRVGGGASPPGLSVTPARDPGARLISGAGQEAYCKPPLWRDYVSAFLCFVFFFHFF